MLSRLILIVALISFIFPVAVRAQQAPAACRGHELEGECCTIDGTYHLKSQFDRIVRDNISISITIPGVGQRAVCAQYSSDGQVISVRNFSLVKDMGEYIAGFYRYFVGIIGILAVTMILWGAIQWISAAGNQGKIGAAKEQISAALVGVLLALGSYAILNLINPNLVKLTTPALEAVKPIEQKIKGNEWEGITFCSKLSLNVLLRGCGFLRPVSEEDQPGCTYVGGPCTASGNLCVASKELNGGVPKVGCWGGENTKLPTMELTYTKPGESELQTRKFDGNNDLDCGLIKDNCTGILGACITGAREIGTKCRDSARGCVIFYDEGFKMLTKDEADLRGGGVIGSFNNSRCF